MSESQTPNVEDEAQAQMVAEAAADAKQEQDEEALEAESTLQEISQRRSDKTIHLRIEGSRVPFDPPKGDLDEIEDYFLDLSGVDEENLTDEQAAQYRQGRDRIVELLAEKCHDPASSEEFWRSEFSNEERLELFNDLAEGGEQGK